MSLKRRNLLAIAVISAALAAGSTAVAMPGSEKICKSNSVSVIAYALSQSMAKQQAVTLWRKKVNSMYGVLWVNWAHAADKSFDCYGVPPKTSCGATARPCRIKQLIFNDEPTPQFVYPRFRMPRDRGWQRPRFMGRR